MRRGLAALVAFIAGATAQGMAAAGQQAPGPGPALVVPPALVRDGIAAAASAPELAKLRKRLDDLKAGRVTRVTVLQIGDSHTSADHFSGRLRARFQAQFGNAGRGQLAPGVPAIFWRPTHVHATQTGAWEVFTSNKDGHEPLPYGLSGYVLRGKAAGDAMTLTVSDEGSRFATAVIGFYRRPDGGSFSVAVDGVALAVLSTEGPAGAYVRHTLAVPGGRGRQLLLRLTGTGSVDLGEWAIYRRTPGVEFVSHGFVGAQVTLMERWNEAVVAQQLADLDPSLILLVFGTNEGFARKDRLATYASRLDARVAALARDAPNAAIVIVAAPDANRIPKYCAGGVAAHESKPCRSLTEEEREHYGEMLVREDKDLCRWHTPASYWIVRAAQQQVAQARGAYWWDWAADQGGFCAASAWYAQGLAQKDRVHLKREGAWRSADRLYVQLVRGVGAR